MGENLTAKVQDNAVQGESCIIVESCCICEAQRKLDLMHGPT